MPQQKTTTKLTVGGASFLLVDCTFVAGGGGGGATAAAAVAGTKLACFLPVCWPLVVAAVAGATVLTWRALLVELVAALGWPIGMFAAFADAIICAIILAYAGWLTLIAERGVAVVLGVVVVVAELVAGT